MGWKENAIEHFQKTVILPFRDKIYYFHINSHSPWIWMNQMDGLFQCENGNYLKGNAFASMFISSSDSCKVLHALNECARRELLDSCILWNLIYGGAAYLPNVNWSYAKTRPLVTAISDKPWCSHATPHDLTQWKIHFGAKRKHADSLLLVWNKVSAFKIVSCLLTDNFFHFASYYIKHKILFQPQKDSNTHNFQDHVHRC